MWRSWCGGRDRAAGLGGEQSHDEGRFGLAAWEFESGGMSAMLVRHDGQVGAPGRLGGGRPMRAVESWKRWSRQHAGDGRLRGGAVERGRPCTGRNSVSSAVYVGMVPPSANPAAAASKVRRLPHKRLPHKRLPHKRLPHKGARAEQEEGSPPAVESSGRGSGCRSGGCSRSRRTAYGGRRSIG